MDLLIIPAADTLSLNEVDLFAGMGGAALGLREAGFRCRLTVERDAAAGRTLSRSGFSVLPLNVDADGQNLVRALHRDLATLSLVHRIGLLWASPPCQPFSAAGGRRAGDDDRDRWPATLVAIDALQPQVFIGENVGSFAKHDRDCEGDASESCSGCVFDGVVAAIAARFPFSGVWTLDAADVGVPQHRTRVFVWGSQQPLPSPELTHGPGRPTPHVTMRNVIGATLLAPGRTRYPLDGSAGRSGSEPTRLDRPSPTVMTTEAKGTRASEASGWTFHGGPDRASDATFLACGIRRITVEEALKLQGFPPDVYPSGTVEESYTQVGNAVPPRLAAAIGRAIRAGWATAA
jgi:DNA (cytosine-5)-methyltransferase 1